ncbi:MAG TPA: carboxypeptidase-like regulatory domain-containing protein [Puia sp.]|nr:carboxypeptidase-like regulatory domain-containing protein [Puia sp.]
MKKILLIPALALCAISILFFSACYKTDINAGSTSADPNHIPPDQTVIASLRGRVIDENGVPMEGASVVSGGITTTSDVNGLFSFSNISMSSRWGYVKVSKTGYYTGSRSVITNGAASNYVNIQMIPRAETGSFAAGAGGVIVVQPGDSAAFGANMVVTASTNAAYTGTVHVFTKYLDPTDANLYKYMPGDLRGIGTDGKETALQSFGMLLVELQGDAGEKLQIMNGQSATLTWAIPSGLQSVAPATIPLWYFNDSTGRWIQQGTAVRQGNSYVGKVSHFSFWNCDAPVGTVNFKVRFKDQHGNPLPYTFFSFQSQTLGTRGGYTDSSGYAQGLILKGQTLVLSVSTECGTILGGANVGPALTDQDLGTIVVTITNNDLTLTGKVVNCAGNPVDSGYINAAIDGLTYRAEVRAGAFTLPVLRCYSTTVPATLTAYDLVAMQRSGSSSVSVTSGNVDAGTLSACQVAYNQYLNFSYPNISSSYTVPPDSVTWWMDPYSDVNLISANYANGIKQTSTSITVTSFVGVGSYVIEDFLYQNFVTGQTFTGVGAYLSVTRYDPVGGYIVGSFSGNLVSADSIGQLGHPLSGSFQVLRTK